MFLNLAKNAYFFNVNVHKMVNFQFGLNLNTYAFMLPTKSSNCIEDKRFLQVIVKKPILLKLLSIVCFY